MKLQFSCACSESFCLSFVHCFNVKIPPFDITIVTDSRAESESCGTNLGHLCCSKEQSSLKKHRELFEKVLLGFLNKKGILDQPGKVNFSSLLCLVLNKAECDFSSLFQECNSHSVFFQCITWKRTNILKSTVHLKSLMNLQGI